MVHRMNVDLSWPAQGGPGVNVWHMRDDGAATANGLADAVRAFYVGLFAAQVVPVGYTASFDGELVDVQTSEILSVDSWTMTKAGGSTAFAALPAMLIMTCRTSLATRSGRGRKFFGPCTPSVFGTDGTITDAVLTDVQADADALLAASEAAIESALGVWSPTDQVFRDFTALQFRDYAAVLRSRRD